MLKRFFDSGSLASKPIEYDPAQLGYWAQSAGYTEYVERERRYQQKALELVGNVHGAFNLAPIIELVRQADALGFDVVVRRPDEVTGDL